MDFYEATTTSDFWNIVDEADLGNEFEYEISRNYKETMMFAIHIVIAILMIGCNGFIITVVAINPELRCSPKYFLVLNLSISSLLDGVFCQSVVIDYFRHGYWIHPCVILFTAETFSRIQFSIFVLMVIAICIDWITSITVVRYSSNTRYKLALFMAVCIWVCSTIGFGTTIMAQLETSSSSISGCIYQISPIVNVVIACFMEAPIIGLLVVLVILLYIVRSRQKRGRYTEEINNKQFPLDIVVASFTTICCMSPLLLLMITNSFVSFGSNWVPLFYLLSRLQMICYIILPLVWLLDSSFRENIKRVFFCRSYSPPTELEMQNSEK